MNCDPVALGQVLRNELARHDLDIQTFQERIQARSKGARGTSYGSVWTYVRGQGSDNPRLELIQAMADELGVLPSYLLSGGTGPRTEAQAQAVGLNVEASASAQGDIMLPAGGAFRLTGAGETFGLEDIVRPVSKAIGLDYEATPWWAAGLVQVWCALREGGLDEREAVAAIVEALESPLLAIDGGASDPATLGRYISAMTTALLTVADAGHTTTTPPEEEEEDRG